MSQIKAVLCCACVVAQCIDKEGECPRTFLPKATVARNLEKFTSCLSPQEHPCLFMDLRGETALCKWHPWLRCSLIQTAELFEGKMMQHVSIIHSHISLYVLSCRFEALVEREWLHAGHPFQARCSRSAFSPSSRNGEAPTFLVFLDCVWQVWHQFPQSFEFNEDFLLLLLQHSYASQFGKAVRHYLCLHPFVVIVLECYIYCFFSYHRNFLMWFWHGKTIAAASIQNRVIVVSDVTKFCIRENRSHWSTTLILQQEFCEPDWLHWKVHECLVWTQQCCNMAFRGTTELGWPFHFYFGVFSNSIS